MRRLGCFLLVLVCAISSCKKEKKNNFKGTIGLTVLSLDNPYFKALADAAQEEAAKNGYNVLVTSGDFDHLESGQNVVVIEDLISTGKSSLNAVKALKESGAVVKGMVAIFSYGFDIATDNFKNSNVALTTLSNYSHLLEQAMDSKYITEKELEIQYC